MLVRPIEIPLIVYCVSFNSLVLLYSGCLMTFALVLGVPFSFKTFDLGEVASISLHSQLNQCESWLDDYNVPYNSIPGDATHSLLTDKTKIS